MLALVFVSGLLFGGSAVASTVVVAFGDSITRGFPYYGYNFQGGEGGAYPTELARLIREEQPDEQVRIHNWGIGGENSFEALARFDYVMARSRPKYTLIMSGTNDLWTGISPYSTAANVRAMIEKTRAHGSEPLVANLTPSTYPGHRGDRIQSLYNPLIEREIELSNAVFNDAYGAFIDQWSALTIDGLHPNIAGYQRLAQTWCELLPLCRGGTGSGMSGVYELLLSHD